MIFSALKKVFLSSGKGYAFAALLIAFFVIVLSTWLPNLNLVWNTVTSSTFSLGAKFEILVGLLGSLRTNMDPLGATSLIIISVLFGVNGTMLLFYVKRQRKMVKSVQSKKIGGASFLGLVSGFLGIGCAACGTLVIAPLLSFLGASSLLAALPLGGQEFRVLSIGLLTWSVYLISKVIQDPALCKVKRRI